MRLRTRTWLVISVLSLVGAAVFWRLGEQRLSNRPGRPSAPAEASPVPAGSTSTPSQAARSPFPPVASPTLLSAQAQTGSVTDRVDKGGEAVDSKPETRTETSLRLSNTRRSAEALLHDDRVLLLRNAVIDTAAGAPREVPEHLRAGAEPGSFILHLTGPMNAVMRDQLQADGIEVVSYLPNAAYLVKASAAQAARWADRPEVRGVLPYQPYYKILSDSLLTTAVRQEPMEPGTRVLVSLLPGMLETGLSAVQELGAGVLAEFRTPFGPGLVVEPPVHSLAALARVPSVQAIEPYRARVLLNDLTRPRLGVLGSTNAEGSFTNQLGLSGSNVLVNINDSGVDATHPDLVGRVATVNSALLGDPAGHGTHVAGVIAGNGRESGTVSNAPGSTIPGANFSGLAPEADLFVLRYPVDPEVNEYITDTYLQETAATNYYVTLARTNLLLSNNSWGYDGAFDYNTAAASYDAAVRDALPGVPGPQAVLYVFAAGNEGFGRSDGLGGEPATIQSPGTGKNVITVGAVEALRQLTNEVVYIDDEGFPQTNQVFLFDTDSNNEIRYDSGRGNVEPGVEGRYGRFKPDVVAPGSFAVSLRSSDWTDPRSFGSVQYNRFEGQTVSPGALENYILFIPPQASEFRIRLLPNTRSPSPFPNLPLYLRYGDFATAEDFVNTDNVLRVPPDATLEVGDWFYAVGNPTLQGVTFDIETAITVTNEFGNYFEELQRLNDDLGPRYRYESGTSVSAAGVTGLLALFQDYFQREQRRVSPALLKALLINGSRSLGSAYNFNVRDVLNLQGWGLVNLTNSLPATEFGVSTGVVYGVQYTDQTGAKSLVTGQTRSWELQVDPAASEELLKVSLVWTDPPGNPGAGIKLVNDLDLEVLDGTNVVYVGNDIPFRSDFNSPRLPGSNYTNDVVNNVENILIRPPLATNYTIRVIARRVNVNAVTEQPDDIAQDFALAVSLGNTTLTNVLRVSEAADLLVDLPLVRTPTNGLPLLSQRVGANPERLGDTPGLRSQWTFFVFTNLQQFTPETVGITNGSNVAFTTFLPPNLGRPRDTLEADLDLYVSTDSDLTNLVPAVVQGALHSGRRGGTETVILTNAPLGEVYYAGVKAEDQQAGEFAFAVVSSNLPFEEDDGQGNKILRGNPFRIAIPDGSADQPQAGYVLAFGVTPARIQRVVATNTIAFDSTGDILVNLSHNQGFAVLNNHALDPTGQGTVFTSVYDDSSAGNTSFGSLLGRPSDGPGSLNDFVGDDNAGLWLLGVTDNAFTQTATNIAFSLLVTPEPPEDEFINFSIEPGGCEEWSVDVPANATNLVVDVSITDPPLPLFLAMKRDERPTREDYDKAADILPPGGSLALGRRDVPPLNSGRYYIALCNDNSVAVNGQRRTRVQVDVNAVSDQSFGIDSPGELIDDARLYSTIDVPEDQEISEVRVGLRIDHPRVSDLKFHLISPQGDRLLLSENRGGPDGTAYGATLGLRRIYTTFTDDTNLTTTPIKLGVPPFTNSAVASIASNRLVFADGFEAAFPRAYVAGESVAPGWRVTGGSVDLIRVPPGTTNVAEGVQYLTMRESGSSIATNVVVVPGQLYRLRASLGRVASSARQGLEVWVNGRLLQEVNSDALQPGWYRDSLLFGATAKNTTIEFRAPADGGPALALDAVSLEEATTPFNAYFLPEESLLQPLKGQRAGGSWRLEITDTRAGPLSQEIGEFDWRLEFIFALPPVDAVRLTNGVPYYGTVGGNEIKYFYVEVPRCATIAENTLAGDLATLLLFGDRDGLPVADLNDFQDDYGPYLNLEPGGIAQFFLTTNSPSSAPLQPGQRYYLAVRNFQPDLTNNAFGIRVQFDCEDPPYPVVPSLTNDVPVTATIPAGPGLHYYQFVVSSNAISADFELTPNTGNVDLYVRRARPNDPYPLPSPSNFDYRADDPDPAVVDLVTVDRLSPPEPLVPGVWFLAIRNTETGPVDYTVRVVETYTTIVNLTNGVPYTTTIPAIDPAVGLRPQDLQYYAFLVSSNSVRAQFETFGADGDVNLYVRKGLPIPTPLDFHFASLNPGPLEEFIAVTNTMTPIWLSPGWWFLTVDNFDLTNVTYTIQATEFPAVITPLTNNVAVTNLIAPGEALDYYSFRVSPEALSAKFEVFGMSDDVQLLLRQALPVPTFNDYTYASTNLGLAPEEIELTPFSFPVGLTPGDWYLSIANASSNLATYAVRASEQTARIVTLTNSLPYNATLPPGGDLDYYQFTVSSNASAAEFKLTSAGAGNLDLFLRKGPPLPAEGNAHYLGLNPGVADELIQIDTNSLPVPLSPGVWYLSVTNHETFPVGYEVTATEFLVEPPPISGQVTNIVITETDICITWISVPGTNYFVVGKTNALDAVWTPLSPTLTAVDTSTTWCLAPPGSWRFFDVLEGESPVTPIPDPVPTLELVGTDICVVWASVPGTNYFVEAKRSTADAAWSTLTPAITATGPETRVCYPVDWGYRLFRVGVGERAPSAPVPLPPELLTVDVSVTSICITWPTQAGLQYLVEGKRTIEDLTWTVISEPYVGDGTTQTLCLDSGTDFRVFRVIEGISVPPGRPPSVPVPNVRLSLDAAFQLCLTWDTLLGAEYFVEGKVRFADPIWTVISPILEANGTPLSYCQPLGSVWRYLQVRRVNTTPEVPPAIQQIEISPSGPVITWLGPAGTRYQVFYTDAMGGLWLPAGGPVTSLDGTFTFVDDGSATGGFGGTRFYRLERLP